MFSGNTYTCSNCGELGPNSDMRPNSEFSTPEYVICKKCHNKFKNKQWRTANREHLIEGAKKWNKENPEKHAEHSRRYHKNHPDRILDQKRRYRKKNKEKVSISRHKRGARKRNLPDSLTTAQWEDCKSYFKGRCAYCGKEGRLSKDHYTPLATDKCLGTTADNIVPACRSCNSSKSNKDPVKWIYDTFSTMEADWIISRVKDYFLYVRGRADQLGRILCLSAHRDDECLSVGGLLAQHKDYVHIHYFNSVHPLVEQSVYDAEAERVREHLGCTVSYSKYQRVNELHTFPITSFITEIEDVINDFKPDTLIIPARSMNQDHRVVHDAAYTASRIHDHNWLINNVLVAEQPETHTSIRLDADFAPNFFVPIDIQKKLELYHLYVSQQRGHRTDDHLTHLAGFRGMQAGVPFAEAFMLVRMVV